MLFVLSVETPDEGTNFIILQAQDKESAEAAFSDLYGEADDYSGGSVLVSIDHAEEFVGDDVFQLCTI